jgi:hypothetical protein
VATVSYCSVYMVYIANPQNSCDRCDDEDVTEVSEDVVRSAEGWVCNFIYVLSQSDMLSPGIYSST